MLELTVRPLSYWRIRRLYKSKIPAHVCVGIFFRRFIPSGKSNTPPAPPPSQFLPL
ncbi:hypothetical protein GY541_001871 [Escherichia coli]|nr:hypothetical protein [Escherichia coli]EFI4097563.1 hypothetical protein [Escherichia coli]EFI4396290.1 hypothetical protein [Escherichia coli]EFI4457260.1 hypothetical protein [Escherichia coli]EFI6598637.1 hypothetical protein [Escherichia coli]